MIIIFLGFFLRVLFTTYNVQIETMPGAEYDAITFHEEAERFSEYLDQKSESIESSYKYRIGWVYSVFLGYLYNFFFTLGTTAHLMASYLSCLAWLLSALVFRGVMFKFNIKKSNINLAILFYCFAFPTSIIYTAITLREVYILLFFNLLLLTIINLYNAKKIKTKIFNIVSIFFISFLMLFLHRANILFFIIFPMLIICYFLITKYNLSKFFIIISGILIIYFLESQGYMRFLFIEIKNYQMGHFMEFQYPRASYYIKSDIEELNYSLITFFIHVLKNTYNYLLQPTLFRIENFKDILAMFENSLRILFMIIILRKSLLKFDRKILFNIFVITILLMELIFSQSSINWGTASRHHVPIMGILILLNFFPLRKTK